MNGAFFTNHPNDNPCPSEAYIQRIIYNYTAMHDRHNYRRWNVEGQSVSESSFISKTGISQWLF